MLEYNSLKFKIPAFVVYIIFYRQLDFSSEPEVANEILENEPKSCLIVAQCYNSIFTRFSEEWLF